MKYTDTSGELIDVIIIGASIALATYLATNYFTAQPITLKGALTATFIGALSGAATFGIGEWAGTMGNFFVRSGFQALAHGTFQGALTGIQGGNFWSGFAAGAISSIASSVWQGGSSSNTYHVGTFSDTVTTTHKGLGAILGLNNSIGTIAFGTVMGAAGASLTGGNFWQGAVTGLFVSALNHVAHMGDDYYQEGQPEPKKKASSGVAEQQRMNLEINKVLLEGVLWVDGVAELSALKWAATTATVKGWFAFGSKGAAKGGPKLLQGFNSVESVIESAGKFERLKGGVRQGFIQGNADHIFKGLSQKYGAKIQTNGAEMFFQSGNIRVGLHGSVRGAGVPTLHINNAGQLFKIRITP